MIIESPVYTYNAFGEGPLGIKATIDGVETNAPSGSKKYAEIIVWCGDNSVTIAEPQTPPVTVEHVQAECERRLALGFDYDFEDARGVHTIATTEKDMDGWREVTDIANARIATSDTTAIGIATETGSCQVTPLQWMDVLKAAAAFRQPIWAYSFALQAQDPIPANYTDDEHWTESE